MLIKIFDSENININKGKKEREKMNPEIFYYCTRYFKNVISIINKYLTTVTNYKISFRVNPVRLLPAPLLMF